MTAHQRLRDLSWGLAAILVAGCAVVPVAGPRWPDEAPEQAYFARAYDEDPANKEVQTRDAYIDWVKQFYSGSVLYPYGWLELQHWLLRATVASSREETADKVRRLGQEIAAEWAKDNRLRRISSAMLVLWSEVIQKAVETGSQLAAIDRIEADVIAILDRRLPPEAINAKRYAPLGAEIPEPI
jgi:hypothetical protein